MSAAKMVADSTQADPAMDSKKRKKKVKKSVKKVVLPEDEDSDLDLKKDLKPVSFYLNDQTAMIEEMFHSVRGASLQRALPELLKSLPLDELKVLCLEQLEVMSKKRIRRILAGEESANISSSGTDDLDDDEVEANSSDDENHINGADSNVNDEKDSKDIDERQDQAVDSTSVVNEELSFDLSNIKRSESDTEIQDNEDITAQNAEPPPVEEVYIKQEPVDSDREYDKYAGGGGDDSDSDDRSRSASEEEEEEDSVIEGGYEEPPEAYTSGSEDGELVRKEVSTLNEVSVKQEPMSDEEEEEGQKERDDKEDESGTDGPVAPEQISEEGNLLTGSNKEASSVDGNPVAMDQMELLELEMRARAIKAMLMTSQQEEEVPDEPAG